MQCIILWRTGSGAIEYISSEYDNDQLRVFPDWVSAVEFVFSNKLMRTVPYQIVELNDWMSGGKP